MTAPPEPCQLHVPKSCADECITRALCELQVRHGAGGGRGRGGRAPAARVLRVPVLHLPQGAAAARAGAAGAQLPRLPAGAPGLWARVRAFPRESRLEVFREAFRNSNCWQGYEALAGAKEELLELQQPCRHMWPIACMMAGKLDVLCGVPAPYSRHCGLLETR